MVVHAGQAASPTRTEVRHAELGLTDQRLLGMYEIMLLARALDERQWILNRQGRQPLVVSCQGHEAAQVGSASALRPGTDLMAPYYRDLAAALVFGVSARDVMLEALARGGGPWTGGRQMPSHFGDPRLKILSSSSCVATQISHAVGSALASSYRGDEAVTICYFGDGATSEGDFHEGLNFAAIHRLPVIFCCENNGLAISVPLQKQSPTATIAERAAAYNMPGIAVDGSDLLAVFDATRNAVERARRGDGPTLIDARVWRLTPHTSDDDHTRYRPREEIDQARERDPIPRTLRYLQSVGLLDEQQQRQIEARVRRSVEEAVAFALAAPEPDPATATRHVFRERLDFGMSSGNARGVSDA